MQFIPENGYIPDSEALFFERISIQSDLTILHALHRDPSVMAYLGATENVLPATRFTLQRMMLENEKFPNLGHWLIYHRVHQKCIGRVALKPLDRTNRTELQILLFPMYWKQGYGFEVAKQVLKGLAMRPVYAIVPLTHLSARRLAEKLGFVMVGPAYYYEREAHLWILEESHV